MGKYESLLDFSSEWPIAMKAIDSHRKAREPVNGQDDWEFLEATVRRKHRGYSAHALYSAFDSQVLAIVRLSVHVLEDEDSTILVSSKRNQLSENYLAARSKNGGITETLTICANTGEK